MVHNEAEYWAELTIINVMEISNSSIANMSNVDGYTPPNAVDEIKERILSGEKFFGFSKLSESDFSGSELNGVNFYGSELENCNFDNCTLENCNFAKCKLSGSTFHNSSLLESEFLSADCRSVTFSDSRFVKSIFPKANCSGSKFQNCSVEQCKFTLANFRNCDFSPKPYFGGGGLIDEYYETPEGKVNLNKLISESIEPFGEMPEEVAEELAKNAHKSLVLSRDPNSADNDWKNSRIVNSDLMEADLSEANLERVDFTETNLFKAKFENSNLHNAQGVVFNRTYVRNSKFTPNAPDVWSLLRRKYTGFNLLVTTVLIGFFFLPYIIKTIIYWSMAKGQGTQIFSELKEIANLEWKEVAAWRMVLGMEDLTIWGVGLGLLLILYNCLRIFVTVIIAPLREEEERSGFTPDASDLSLAVIAHLMIKILGVIAILLLIYNVMLFLDLTIAIPAGTVNTPDS